MSLRTRSIFYYGHDITGDNAYIDFDEGGLDLVANLNFGSYSLTEFAAEVSRALNEAGALEYTVTVNRSTQKVTVAADGNFTLQTSSGAHAGASALSLLGFTGSDETGGATYTGDSIAGFEYRPQFNLQSYVPPENYRKPQDVTIMKTASGKVEMVKFGDIRMMELDIKFATSIGQPAVGPLDSNPTGVQDLVNFMEYITEKAPIEFMPNIDDRATFYTVILESTPDNQEGAGFKLKERFDVGMPGYFDTGVLVFRVVE